MTDPRFRPQEHRDTTTVESLGRYPGRRRPRKGDLVLTIILSVVLYALTEQYVVYAIDRGHQHAAFTGGLTLATILAVVAPLVLAVFSTVFSILLILRRRLAFWLPVMAMILIVALYSVTGAMLDQAVLNHSVG
ncbi:hypothetical protein [Frondihabitans australicus]|uniref:Uncharacterized protein n=1 Tax=Frondihabitans australicus TaxID=386892 RepID=A0A495ILU7_9MICO|nr:hypothetical protein [Frondihabitans australicus]RKR76136.1 hypothetical protein C8E83_3301 [Frondihabitans australicus]